MLCDVASIFVVRTLIVSQAYTMVLTLIDNTRIHIFIYMYSIPRRHFTCPFTDLSLYVNKRTAIHDSNIYTCNRGTFCPRAHRQNKDHIKPDQLSNHIAAWQLTLRACVLLSFLTFKSTISIMIKFILNLLSKSPWCSGYFTCLINQRSQV